MSADDEYCIVEEHEEKQPLPYTVRECSATQRIFNIYISQEIGEAHHYVDIIEKLRLAQPSDIFYLYLNTPGGYVSTGAQIMHAMKDCQGRVVAVLDGTVCSMGALIFLAADEFIIHDYSQLMFHNYSGGVAGKGHEQIAHLNATTEWYTNMLVDICSPFLDPEEIQEVLNGHDLWLTPDQVRERLEIVVAMSLEEVAAEEEALLMEQEKEVLKRIAARERKEAREAAKKSAPKKDTKKSR